MRRSTASIGARRAGTLFSEAGPRRVSLRSNSTRTRGQLPHRRLRGHGLQKVRAVTHVKAREWIKPLPAGRDSNIDAGVKDTIQAVWDHVRWDIEREPVGDERPWVSAEALAAETGEKLGTIRDRLRKATKAGWIRWEKRAWSLAWRVPFAHATPVVVGATPVACDSGYHEVRPELPDGATPVAGDYDSSRTKLSKNEVIERSQEHTTAGEPAPVEGHPCTVEDSPVATPAGVGLDDPPSPSRSKTGQPRKRKPPAEVEDIADGPVGQLLAEHDRLRRAALKRHGHRETALPGPTSGDGRSLRARLRKAIDAHGVDVCTRALRWRAAEWDGDPGALLRWSTDSVWSPKSLAVSIRESAGQAGARASPARRGAAPTLSCEPSGLQMPVFQYDKDAECL